MMKGRQTMESNGTDQEKAVLKSVVTAPLKDSLMKTTFLVFLTSWRTYIKEIKLKLDF